MRAVRGNDISMIFQEASTSLNPVLTAGEQVAESFYFHRRAEMLERVLGLLGLSADRCVMIGDRVSTDIAMAARGGLDSALVRTGEAATRSGLTAMTGLARSTVSQRVDALISAGLLLQAGEALSPGGRPPLTVVFHAGAGGVLTAALAALSLGTELLAGLDPDLAGGSLFATMESAATLLDALVRSAAAQS